MGSYGGANGLILWVPMVVQTGGGVLWVPFKLFYANYSELIFFVFSLNFYGKMKIIMFL